MELTMHTSTTSDLTTDTILLNVKRFDDGYLVSDLSLGRCYGHGDSLAEALTDWVAAITDQIAVLKGQKLAPRLAPWPGKKCGLSPSRTLRRANGCNPSSIPW